MTDLLERMRLTLRQVHRKRPTRGERTWHIAPDLVEQLAEELSGLERIHTDINHLVSIRAGETRAWGYRIVVDEKQPPGSMALVRSGPEVR